MKAIEVKNISKSFKIYFDKGATLKEKILFQKRNRYEEHHVLKGISLTINKGEVVGLVGQNGCGKSTLLKLMTRIIYPDKGTIEVNGKVSSLLELGAGFHPDMSGRENIYTNASIFGLNKKQIDERIENIIDFSELDEFIDNPVRTYSSGMYMRLAFSVAINVDAEILLVDEILAVGDAAFQAKCFNKLQEIKNNGTTIVMVSHDLGSIERLCDKAIWIDEGIKRIEGNPHDVIAQYLGKIMTKKENHTAKENSTEQAAQTITEDTSEDSSALKDIEQGNRTGNKAIEVINVNMKDYETGENKVSFKTGQSILIEIDYKKNDQRIVDSVVGIGIFRNDGLNCYGTNTFIDENKKYVMKDNGKIQVILEEILLLEGEYTLDIAFHDEYGMPYDYIRRVMKFNVYSEIKDVGVFRIKHKYIQG